MASPVGRNLDGDHAEAPVGTTPPTMYPSLGDMTDPEAGNIPRGDPTNEEITAAATAYNIGIPNFKLFLGLRYILAVWSLFVGWFYEEISAWLTGLVFLVTALIQTAARIKPTLWKKYRKSLLAMDIIGFVMSVIGCFMSSLIPSLYWFNVGFTSVQLGILLMIWPNRQVHPFCYPTFKKQQCGTMSTEMCSESKEESNDKSWRMKKLPYLIVWTLTGLTLSLMILTTGQRLIVYPGTLIKVRIPPDIADVKDLNMNAELISLITKDRKFISALFLKPKWEEADRIEAEHRGLPRITVWIFYGNAGNMVHQMECIVPRMLAAYPNLQFFIFSYRGYAKSDGRPHINGLRKDIDACVEYLRSTKLTREEQKYLVGFGHSIGGALLSDLIGRHPGFLKAAIVSNTFMSMEKMSETWRIPYLWPICSERWDSAAALRKAVENRSLPPLLMMSSRKDGLIPPYHMDALGKIAQECPRTAKHHVFLKIPEGTHNDWDEQEVFLKEWRLFFAKVGRGEFVNLAADYDPAKATKSDL